MKILLAEDDPHVSMIMQLCLEKMGGHQTVLAEDGQAALLTALQEPFDLILLDGMMPKKSGLEVAKELQARGSKVPIIFLSARNVEPQHLELAWGYIPKPFEPTEICARIDSILASRGVK